MKSSFSRPVLLLMAGCVLAAATDAAQDQVAVSGRTYELVGEDYRELANVEIQVFRRGSPVLDKPKESEDDGSFHVLVPGSEPFDIVFFRPSKVPEIYTLAGKPGTRNELHVTVLTKTQAKQFGISPWKQAGYIYHRASGNKEPTQWLRAMYKDVGPPESRLQKPSR